MFKACLILMTFMVGCLPNKSTVPVKAVVIADPADPGPWCLYTAPDSTVSEMLCDKVPPPTEPDSNLDQI